MKVLRLYRMMMTLCLLAMVGMGTVKAQVEATPSAEDGLYANLGAEQPESTSSLYDKEEETVATESDGRLLAVPAAAEGKYFYLPKAEEKNGLVVRYVDNENGNEQNNGKSWKTARFNLQEVIEEVNNMILTGKAKKGRIYVASSGITHKPSRTVGGGNQGLAHTSFKLYSGIEVYGSCDNTVTDGNERRVMKIAAGKAKGWEIANPTVLTGSHSTEAVFEWIDKQHMYKTTFANNSYHVVWFATGKGNGFDERGRAYPLDPKNPALLDGVVIKGGDANVTKLKPQSHNSYGGGVYMVGNSILRNCEVTLCRATRAGGAIYLDGGGRVEDCYVHANQSEGVGLIDGHGGGICIADSGVVTRCLITDNMARIGGGLALKHDENLKGGNGQKLFNRYLPSASATIVANNTASAEAGGVYLYYGGTINQMTIVNNHCSGSEMIIRNRRYGISGGAYIEDAGVIFNSVLYGNEVRNLKDASMQYASYRVNTNKGVPQGKQGADDKNVEENRPYMHYAAIQNLEQTDWSTTVRRGVIPLQAIGDKNPAFIQGYDKTGVQQLVSGPEIKKVYKGTYEQLADDINGDASKFDYYWKPMDISLLHTAGVNLKSFVTRKFMLYAQTDVDFTGELYSSKSTLGARKAEDFKFMATDAVQNVENPAGASKTYTLFVDPNIGAVETNPIYWGMSWDAPFRYLEDALEYVRQVRNTGFTQAQQGIAIPQNAKFQILVKEGTNTTASNHYHGDLHEASFKMVGNTQIYGGYAKELKGTDITSVPRNPHLYRTILSADVLNLKEGRNSDHVVIFDGVSNAILDGFQIEKGYALIDIKNHVEGHTPKHKVGAGILIHNENATAEMTGNEVRNCRVANCSAEEGAAIWAKAEGANIGGTKNDGTEIVGVKFENCIFHNNSGHSIVSVDAETGKIIYSEGSSAIYVDAAAGKSIRLLFDHCNIVKNKGTALTTGPGEVRIEMKNSMVWANASQYMDFSETLTQPLGFHFGGIVKEGQNPNWTYRIQLDHCLLDKNFTYTQEGEQNPLPLESGWTNCQGMLTYQQGDVDVATQLPTFPGFINPTKNIGALYTGDQTYYGGRVDFTPRNMNPMVNAASDVIPDLGQPMTAKDMTAVATRDFGGAADIGALENTELPERGRVIYVKDYKDTTTPGGDGSSWQKAINGNYSIADHNDSYLPNHPFQYVDAEIPNTGMTGLQWAVDEAYYRSLKKNTNNIDYTTSFSYMEGALVGDGQNGNKASGPQKTQYCSQVLADELVEVWVAAGIYTKGNGFFMRDGVDVYGGFPGKGSPGKKERNPRNPDYKTIIQTLSSGVAHDMYSYNQTQRKGSFTDNGKWGPKTGFQKYNWNIDEELRYDLNKNYTVANTTQRVLTQPFPYYKGRYIQNEKDPTSIEFRNEPINGFSQLTSWDGFVIQNGRTRISNSRDGGAGVALRKNGRIVNCVVRNNVNIGYSMMRGGGIFCNDGEIVNCQVEDNVLDFLSNNNDTGMGGGLYLRTGTVYNTCFTKNASLSTQTINGGGWSGAVHFENGKFYNNTITENAGTSALKTGNWFDSGSIDMYNTIVFHNPDCNDVDVFIAEPSGKFKANVKYCLFEEYEFQNITIDNKTGNISLSKSNTPFAPGSLKLKPQSVAINAGTEEFDSKEITLPDYDAEYNQRIQDCRVDIGAYEFNGAYAISPDETSETDKLIFYVTQGGAGVNSGASVANAACAQKLQKILDAAGRYRLDPNNAGKEIVVRLAGDKLATDTETGIKEFSGFGYEPTRSVQPGSGNPREWSLMVPRGITVEGGWDDGFTKQNVTANPTRLYGYYQEKEATVAVYHAVTFTEKIYNEEEEVQPETLTAGTTILDGLFIEGGRADGEDEGHQRGGAAIVPGYAHIRNCILQNNKAAGDGGALYLEPKALVSGCLLKGNEASRGGAIGVKAGETDVNYDDNLDAQVAEMAHIYTSTFVHNKATGAGGALWFKDNVRVNSSVLWKNEASENMNVSGETNPHSTSNQKVTLKLYPMAYCAVENVRVPGLNNIRVNSDNAKGVRFDIYNYTEKEMQDDPDKKAQQHQVKPYYYPTSYSLLARAGMPISEYEILVKDKKLASSDFTDIARGIKTVNGEQVDNQFIEIGARAFNGKLLIVPTPETLLRRLYVAQSDVDWDIVQLLEAEKNKQPIYSLKGSSFAYPMALLEEALEYIRMVRNEPTLKASGQQSDGSQFEGIANVKFEIFVAGGTYFPSRYIQGQSVDDYFTESSKATYLVPEGVSIYGGLDNIGREQGANTLFYGQKADKAKDITLTYGSQTLNLSIEQDATPKILNTREHFDRNINGIEEPWEMKHQTILSGNVVDREDNVHHVITCMPYGVGELPDRMKEPGISEKYGKYSSSDKQNGLRPSLLGGEVVLDGLEFYEGEAQAEAKSSANAGEGGKAGTGDGGTGTANIEGRILENYSERGGAVLVAGNVGQINPEKQPNVWGWVGPTGPGADKLNAVGRRNIPLTIRNCRFNGNIAGEGGAVFTDGELKIYSSSFERNSAKQSGAVGGNGGAVAANYEVTMLNTVFENNEADVNGQGEQIQADKVTASGVGGALYVGKNGWTHILNSNVVRNKAKSYPAFYFGTPNQGMADYSVKPFTDADASGADRHMVVNSLFWGNEAVGGKKFVVNYMDNQGKRLEQIPQIADDVAEAKGLPSEALWFCAYEDGCGLEPVRLNIKGVDMREAEFKLNGGVHYLPYIFYDHATKQLGPVPVSQENEFKLKYLANYNVWLNQDNYDLNGPNFGHPSDEAGVEGYLPDASWTVTRINNLTDNGWTMLEQSYDQASTAEHEEDKFSFEISPTGYNGKEGYTGKGIYYDWYYNDNPDGLNLAIGMDPYMKSSFSNDANKAKRLRVSLNPDKKYTKTYIDIGVYEYRHIALKPYRANMVDILWVCQNETSEEADGSTIERATSNVQHAIETLLSERNNHHKEIRFLAGEYTPSVAYEYGEAAKPGEEMKLNKGFLINTASQDNRAVIDPSLDGGPFGIKSLSFRGGWSNVVSSAEGVQNVKEFPSVIATQNSASDEKENFRHLFYIEDAVQRKTPKGESTTVVVNGEVIPIIFDGLTLCNEFAAGEEGNAIYYKKQTYKDQNQTVDAKEPVISDLDKNGNTSAVVPKLAIHRCSFIGNGKQKVAQQETSAVTIEAGGGSAIVYNNVFHHNVDKPLKAVNTAVVNCTFALNGKNVILTSLPENTKEYTSSMHNSVLWKNNATTQDVFGSQLNGSWVNNAQFTYNAVTGIEADPTCHNVSLDNKNSDLIKGPNFKDPREGVTTLAEMYLSDFSLLPSIKLLNKASDDTYAQLMSDYCQAVKIVTKNQPKPEDVVTVMSKTEVLDKLKTDNLEVELQKGTPIYPYRTDVANLQRRVDKFIDLGAYEYQQPLRREIYVNPSMINGGDGSSWQEAYPQNKMQDAIDMAAVYAHNQFLDPNVVEENAQAYVFMKGDREHTQKHLTMRAGVKVFGSVEPSMKEVAEVEQLETSSAAYTAALEAFVKKIKLISPGMAAPYTQRTVVSSIKASPACEGHLALMDGFEVKGLPAKGASMEEVTAPVVNMSVADGTNPTKLVLRNSIINGFYNKTPYKDDLNNSVVRVENGLMYNCLVFNNKVDAPQGTNVSTNYGIVTIGNGDSGKGQLVNCTVVGEPGMQRIVNVAATSAPQHIHNTIVYPGNVGGSAKTYGFCDYFKNPKYIQVFAPEPYLNYQLAENSKDIALGVEKDEFKWSPENQNKFASFIDYANDFDLLGNPRRIGAKVDFGCYETWTTKDEALTLSTASGNYGGYFYPQRGSVVYLSGHPMILADDFALTDAIRPGFLLLQDKGGWYGKGKATLALQYAAIDRSLGQYNLMSLPFDCNYADYVKDFDSQHPETVNRPQITVKKYDAVKRAESEYRYADANSPCWVNWSSSDQEPYIPANQGVGVEVPAGQNGTYRFFGMATGITENIYVEKDAKTVVLKQNNDLSFDRKNRPLFTTAENMGWNLVGMPYLVNDYVTGESAATNTGYAMDVPHLFYRMTSDGGYSTPASWEKNETSTLDAGEGFFTQTAIIDGDEQLTFALPTVATGPLPPGQSKRVTLTSKMGTDELVVRTSPDTKNLTYTYQVDGLKWMAENEDLPQLYLSNDQGTRFSWASAAPVATELKLGVKVPEAGLYTFAIPDQKDFSEFTHIWLADRKAGVVTDLKLGNYTVAMKQAMDHPERFTLKFGGTAPVIDTAAGRGWYQVFIRNGELHVRGLEGGESIRVYDVAGRDVLSDEATAREYTVPLNAGVYVVKVNGQVYKVR